MRKADFIKAFPGEDAYRMAKLFEQLDRAKSFDHFFCTDMFLTPNVWGPITAMGDFQGFVALGEDHFERRVLARHVPEHAHPLTVVEIVNRYPERTLTHRDYLGALMGLGLEREKFGDLFLSGDKALLVTFPAVAEWVESMLHQVGSASVSVVLRDYRTARGELQPAWTKMRGVVASMRLDTVTAELGGTSRSKALEWIQEGRVLHNYNETRDKAKEIKAGDTLTIRGKGKFKIGPVEGTTQKGNLRLTYHRFD